MLAILGAHEFGHYFACVYYRVNASLPYFLPLPLARTGTLGAVIRIRQPIPGKRALFDIGIAGPLAGFVVLIPVLFIGMMMSEVVEPAGTGGQVEFGEPLLFKLAAWLMFGPIPDGQTIYLHPLGFAAWFGHAGHGAQSLPGRPTRRRAHRVRRARPQEHPRHPGHARSASWPDGVRVDLWLVWTVLIVVMLFVLGPHHPRVFDEDVPLDRDRASWLAAGRHDRLRRSASPPTPIELARPRSGRVATALVRVCRSFVPFRSFVHSSTAHSADRRRPSPSAAPPASSLSTALSA